MKNPNAKQVAEITITDPDTNLPVQVTILKLTNGGMIGIDSSYLSNTEESVYSPFDKKVLKIEE